MLFFFQVARNWAASNKPLDTIITREDDIPAVSAGMCLVLLLRFMVGSYLVDSELGSYHIDCYKLIA